MKWLLLFGSLLIPSLACGGFRTDALTITGSTISINGTIYPPFGSTNTINNQDTLQSGATFYVSSGTVQGPLSVGTTTNGNVLKFSRLTGTGTVTNDIVIASTGSAHYFSGSSYAQQTAANTPHLSTYTVSFWMKGSASNQAAAMLVSIFLSDNASPLQIFKNNTGYRVTIGNGATNTATNSTKLIWDNNWHHIVVTFDSVTNALKSYVDNVLDLNTTLAHGAYTGSDTRLNLGARDAAFHYIGYMDEFKISSGVWTAGNVSTEYNSGSGRYGTASDSGIVLGYHMDEGTGSTMFAYVGSSVGITGTPLWVAGKVPVSNSISTVAATVVRSENGVLTNERGIQTFGDTNGRTFIDGQTVRFGIHGVEKGRLDENGFFGFGTTVPGAPITANAASATSPAFEVQGAATPAWAILGNGSIQVASSFKIINTAGSELMSTSGAAPLFTFGLQTNSGLIVNGGSSHTGGIYTGGFNAAIRINDTVGIFGTSSASSVKFSVQASAAQTANVQEWLNSSSSSGTVISSNLAMIPFPKTKAQLASLVSKAGELYYCTDCTVDNLVISSGTVAGSFERVGARGTPIQ